MENLFSHNCPICKTKLVYNDRGLHCPIETGCGFFFPNRVPNEPWGTEISEEDYMFFEQNGYTPRLKCKSEKGYPYMVRLVLDRQKRKVVYKFEKSERYKKPVKKKAEGVEGQLTLDI